MNQDLALNTLGRIMEWDDQRSRDEFRWVRLMARLKYDEYRDFQAGMRFIESLTTWLQQFDKAERETAYGFVRRALVYVGPSEMQHLVEQFYPRTVRDRLIKTVAAERGLKPYEVLGNPAARAELDKLRRQTLFMGLSDGARMDVVRHANAGVLSHEQIVVFTQVDKDKWQDLLKDLRRDLGDPKACFRMVYLLDDFVGTGTTFLRYDDEKKKWGGKLVRFKESVDGAKDVGPFFSQKWELCVHHYIGSASAVKGLNGRKDKAKEALGGAGWADGVHFSFGMEMPRDLPIDAVPGRFSEFIALTQKYYDPVLSNRHTGVGGADHLGLGYGGCALPLILHHNTPNNSVALLWAETDGGIRDGVLSPAMRPLFRRRQRHV
jgi:hypothetical protein